MASKQVLSPLPGTFYRKPAPDQPPYKEAGGAVAVGDVIGLIEVMKSFHEVKSDAGGKVATSVANGLLSNAMRPARRLARPFRAEASSEDPCAVPLKPAYAAVIEPAEPAP